MELWSDGPINVPYNESGIVYTYYFQKNSATMKDDTPFQHKTPNCVIILNNNIHLYNDHEDVHVCVSSLNRIIG